MLEFQKLLKPDDDNIESNYQVFIQFNNFCSCPLLKSPTEFRVRALVYCINFYETYINEMNGFLKIQYLLLLSFF